LFDDAAEAPGIGISQHNILRDVFNIISVVLSVMYCAPTGDDDARNELFDALAELRDSLAEALGRNISESMELQYLHYPGRGSGIVPTSK
jgi:hypothetical protein